MSNQPIIRILLADDHDQLRGALRSLVETQPDLRVVAEARDGGEAVRLAGEVKPDVVVMDLRMPGMDGYAATRRVIADAPGTRVIVLSAHDDARMVAAALDAGACAYVVKDRAFEQLCDAVRAAHDDGPARAGR